MTPAHLLLIGTTKERSEKRERVSFRRKERPADRRKREEWGLPIV